MMKNANNGIGNDRHRYWHLLFNRNNEVVVLLRMNGRYYSSQIS